MNMSHAKRNGSRSPEKNRAPFALDAARTLAGVAHADAHPSPKASAKRNGRHLGTEYVWRKVGPPPLVNYMLNCEFPFRLVAWAKAVAKKNAIDRLTAPQLIQRYHEILQAEKKVEAKDTALDLNRHASWLDRAAASERDAALDEEKAAIERRFAELRLSWEGVWK